MFQSVPNYLNYSLKNSYEFFKHKNLTLYCFLRIHYTSLRKLFHLNNVLVDNLSIESNDISFLVANYKTNNRNKL